MLQTGTRALSYAYTVQKKQNTNMFTTVNLKVHSESNLNIYLPKDIQTDIHVFAIAYKYIYIYI
jgi:hypothetical protein